MPAVRKAEQVELQQRQARHRRSVGVRRGALAVHRTGPGPAAAVAADADRGQRAIRPRRRHVPHRRGGGPRHDPLGSGGGPPGLGGSTCRVARDPRAVVVGPRPPGGRLRGRSHPATGSDLGVALPRSGRRQLRGGVRPPDRPTRGAGGGSGAHGVARVPRSTAPLPPTASSIAPASRSCCDAWSWPAPSSPPLAVLQFFTGVGLGRVFRIPGLQELGSIQAIQDRSTFNRVSATASHPIELGVVLGMLFPLAVHFASAQRAADPVGLRRA